MLSSVARLPAFVFQLIANEADRMVACGPTEEEDVPISEIKAAGAILSPTVLVGPEDLVYEVVRQHRNGNFIFQQDHTARFCQSLHEVFGIPIEQAAVTGAQAEVAIQRLQDIHCKKNFPCFEQNIKYVAWRDLTPGKGISTLAYYVHSVYPPSEWYQTGSCFALLFGHKRDNPHAKVVYPALKAKAAQQAASLRVFESLIVHDDGLVPEGVRSNYLLVSKDDTVLFSSDKDILIGTTMLAVKNQCKRLSIPIETRRLTLQDIVEAKAVAMLATSVNVLPINSIVLDQADIGHPVVSGLLPYFVKGAYEKQPSALCLTKESASNSLLQRLNQEYSAQAFA